MADLPSFPPFALGPALALIDRAARERQAIPPSRLHPESLCRFYTASEQSLCLLQHLIAPLGQGSPLPSDSMRALRGALQALSGVLASAPGDQAWSTIVAQIPPSIMLPAAISHLLLHTVVLLVLRALEDDAQDMVVTLQAHASTVWLVVEADAAGMSDRAHPDYGMVQAALAACGVTISVQQEVGSWRTMLCGSCQSL